MIDIEKLDIILNDKRTSPRSKLIFLLLAQGRTLTEIVNLSADKLDCVKDLHNGETLFLDYAKRPNTLKKIKESGFLFPNIKGQVMQETSLLASLRRPCRLNGFQLYELGLDGLVNTPTIVKSEQSKSPTSFDDIKNFIQGK